MTNTEKNTPHTPGKTDSTNPKPAQSGDQNKSAQPNKQPGK
jgi:hypothetical protein